MVLLFIRERITSLLAIKGTLTNAGNNFQTGIWKGEEELGASGSTCSINTYRFIFFPKTECSLGVYINAQ